MSVRSREWSDHQPSIVIPCARTMSDEVQSVGYMTPILSCGILQRNGTSTYSVALFSLLLPLLMLDSPGLNLNGSPDQLRQRSRIQGHTGVTS